MLLLGLLFVPSANASVAARNIVPATSQVIAAMQQMADWQITALGASQDESWETATFFDGLLALYEVAGGSQFLSRALSWGTANNWTPASPQSDPNNQNAGQAFVEMYLLQGSSDSNQLTPTENVMNGVMAQGGTGQQVWWWADSLFMAPPTFARVGYATGDTSYFSFMDSWYWQSANYLIDPAANLFWRDSRFFGKTCPNGQDMFWSRGNAWVMAGLVRILEFLPQNDPDRPQFVSLLQNMAAALAPLQQPDGYWPSCLTDPTDYPEPESSGTAGFVYAMAWAINNGFLNAATYTPIVQKGWNALVNAIQPTGALGWVQPPGNQPAASTAADTFPYGVGLALLAGSEVAKMTQPLITLTPASAPAGTMVTVSGSNFNAGDATCTITSTTSNLVSSPVCSVSGGSLTGSFEIGPVANGLYTVTVTGSTEDSATAIVTVSTATQVTMTVSYLVVGGGTPTAPVFNYVSNGVSESLTLTTTATAVTVDSGSAWSVTPNPLTGSSSSQQWIATMPLSGTATATTIQFSFQHQYNLTMNVIGPGTVTPSNGWYNAGAKVTIKATANSGHKFKSWTGTGTGSYTGTSKSHLITMNAAITETATFT
jgi:rhamnogalacturonyl hydrolase YesR